MKQKQEYICDITRIVLPEKVVAKDIIVFTAK